MIVNLYTSDQQVLKMHMEINLCSLQVLELQIVNESLLPIGLRYLLNNSGETNGAHLAARWLQNRCLPDDRRGLDELLLSLYQLPPHLFGRMYPYKHIAATLSYFASGFDAYYISPDRVQTICHVLEDPRFWSLYFWQPARTSGPFPDNPDIARLFAGEPARYPLFHGSFETRSLTIPSRFSSWWEGRCLIQRLPANRNCQKAVQFLSIADRMGIAGVRRLRGGNLITDYSEITGEVTWLGEFGLCENGPTIREAAAGVFGKDCVDHLLDFTAQAEEAGINLTIGNLGFLSGGEKNQCVAIL